MTDPPVSRIHNTYSDPILFTSLFSHLRFRLDRHTTRNANQSHTRELSFGYTSTPLCSTSFSDVSTLFPSCAYVGATCTLNHLLMHHYYTKLRTLVPHTLLARLPKSRSDRS